MRKYIGVIITSLILIAMVGVFIWPGKLIKKTVDNFVTNREEKASGYDFKDETEALRESAEKETSENKSSGFEKGGEKKSDNDSFDKKDNAPSSKFDGFEPAAPERNQKLNEDHKGTPSIITLPEPEYKTAVPKTTPKPTPTPTPKPTATPTPTTAPIPTATPTATPALPPTVPDEIIPEEGDYRGTEGIKTTGDSPEEKPLENQSLNSVDAPMISVPEDEVKAETSDAENSNDSETVESIPKELPKLNVSGEIKLPYDKVKVGLYYYDDESEIRNHTLPYVTLMRSRKEGSPILGYRFGIFNDKREFTELGYTDSPNLIICKDKNISACNKYETGCYHIMLTNTFNTFEEAVNFIKENSANEAYKGAFPMRYFGSYRVLLGQYKDNLEAFEAIKSRGVAGSVTFGTAYCISVINYDTGEIVFEFDEGLNAKLAISPIADESGEKPQTWISDFKYYGDFEFYRRTDDLTVVNVVNIEDYVCGVLPYEMSSTWPAEALKAQAVCARTYAVNHFGAYNEYGFDLSNDIFSQVYKGTNRSIPYSDEQVKATEGLYLTHNGRLISAMYSSSHGGGSESSKNVFGGKHAYLTGVVDPYEASTNSINKFSSWKRTFSSEELRDILRKKYKDNSIGNVEKIEIEKSPTGNTVVLRLICEKYDVKEFKGPLCYSFSTGYMGLPSIRYSVTKEGDNFKFEGSGWGHSLGLSQFGAYGMAANYNFSFDQILGFYYNDVALVRGIK